MTVGFELADVPWAPDPIATERLILRPSCASDRSGYIDLLTSDQVRKYLGGPRRREELELQAPEIPRNRPGVFAVEALGMFVVAVVLDVLPRRRSAGPSATRGR